jgi:hypothetical protein
VWNIRVSGRICDKVVILGSEILTAVAMESSIFYACCPPNTGLLFGLLFDPGDCGDMFLGNVG